jgi:hypothetical protein
MIHRRRKIRRSGGRDGRHQTAKSMECRFIDLRLRAQVRGPARVSRTGIAGTAPKTLLLQRIHDLRT